MQHCSGSAPQNPASNVINMFDEHVRQQNETSWFIETIILQ
jgi:hypothetical protein